ncbi:hypothetical protein SRHO_G00170100 [Serrasalmus rhombeus]
MKKRAFKVNTTLGPALDFFEPSSEVNGEEKTQVWKRERGVQSLCPSSKLSSGRAGPACGTGKLGLFNSFTKKRDSGEKIQKASKLDQWSQQSIKGWAPRPLGSGGDVK